MMHIKECFTRDSGYMSFLSCQILVLYLLILTCSSQDLVLLFTDYVLQYFCVSYNVFYCMK